LHNFAEVSADKQLAFGLWLLACYEDYIFVADKQWRTWFQILAIVATCPGAPWIPAIMAIPDGLGDLSALAVIQ